MVPLRISPWTLAFVVLLVGTLGRAQESAPERIFYDTRVVNGHSTELTDHGQMKFIISHRFGRVNNGAYSLWGLDNATMRMGLDYGATPWLNVGIGRSSFEKTVDGFVKARVLRQNNGKGRRPVSVALLAGMSVNGLRFDDPERNDNFSHRINYTYQALIARRFGDRLSLQVMPTVVHRNLVPDETIAHDIVTLGVAGRFMATKRFTVAAEYYAVAEGEVGPDLQNNVLSVGFEIETKAHVFQIHMSNSRGMTEKFFAAGTVSRWDAGEIHLGFNITRDFKIKGRKY